MRLFSWLTAAMAPLTLGGAVLAFWAPWLFVPVGPYLKWLFAVTMFALGLVLRSADLHDTLRHPGRIALGVATQFTVMPLLGFAAAWIGRLDAATALGFIVVGAAPGAMASNVIVYLAGGAVAYSVALTTVATFLSPLATPFLVKTLGGAYMDIDFLAMTWTITWMVVLPLAAGMALRGRFGRWRGHAQAIAPAMASVAIVIICAFAVAANRDRLAEVSLTVVMLVILMNALGYVLGWLLAAGYRFDGRHRMTLAIEIGMQNAGLGVVLAAIHFADRPQVSLPAALFAFWCVLTAAGASAWLRRHSKGLVPPAPRTSAL